MRYWDRGQGRRKAAQVGCCYWFFMWGQFPECLWFVCHIPLWLVCFEFHFPLWYCMRCRSFLCATGIEGMYWILCSLVIIVCELDLPIWANFRKQYWNAVIKLPIVKVFQSMCGQGGRGHVWLLDASLCFGLELLAVMIRENCHVWNTASSQ